MPNQTSRPTDKPGYLLTGRLKLLELRFFSGKKHVLPNPLDGELLISVSLFLSAVFLRMIGERYGSHRQRRRDVSQTVRRSATGAPHRTASLGTPVRLVGGRPWLFQYSVFPSSSSSPSCGYIDKIYSILTLSRVFLQEATGLSSSSCR